MEELNISDVIIDDASTMETIEPALEDPALEDPVSEEPASEDSASEDPASEDPASEDPASEDPTSEGYASEGSASEDQEENETDKIVHALKKIIGIENNETSETENIETTETEDTETGTTETENEQETVNSVDYSNQISILNDNVLGLGEKVDDLNLLYTQVVDSNYLSSPLNDLSLTNILLILIFVLFLAEFAIKFVRGLL